MDRALGLLLGFRDTTLGLALEINYSFAPEIVRFLKL
jgi:hypothetical protein